MGKKVSYKITSLTKPLGFGPYKGQSLVDIIEYDKLYFKEILSNSKKHGITEKLGKRIQDLLDSYNLPALGKYRKLPTVKVYDASGSRFGYFILDQEVREHSQNVPLEGLRFEVTVMNDVRAEAIILRDKE